ncbi:MAG: lipopolysaccharide heptosyltransferase II [Deltaproteobacteria bacterium]|nr:lipopolysaccharide heptosyltransferase II [Deltaproteobacteria bacterium]MBW2417261.1 lipopolysaccharide heptosyltransferase II [Deltaproteobacteria bacterium]
MGQRSEAAEILVRGPNWTGDVVMATPGFRALREGFPRARITLQLRPGLEALVAGSPWFDEVLPLRSYHQGVSALLREARELRRAGRFDLGLCLPDSFSSALLMRLAGVRRVVGYRRGPRSLLLHQALTPPPEWGARRMVARERFVLDLVAGLGCGERGTGLELFTTAEEEKQAEQQLQSAGIGEGEPLAALAPGASFGPSKLWPARSFARVGDALARAGARVVLLGSPAEAALTRSVLESMEEGAANLAGALDLGGLKALLRRAALLVCNDAGARHVAVAFGVPCIVLMGPTSLEKTNLNLEAVQVFESDVECRPCYQRSCPIDHRCMTRLEPGPVARVACELLGQRVERGR